MSNIILPNDPGPLTGGTTRDVNDLLENFDAASAVINGNLDTGNFSAGAAIADSKLASPAHGVWRDIAVVHTFLNGSLGAGTRVIGPGGRLLFLSGSINTGNAADAPMLFEIPFEPTLITNLFTFPSKTCRIRLLIEASADDVPPTGVSFTARLADIIDTPASGQINYSSGTYHISHVGITLPTANGHYVGSDELDMFTTQKKLGFLITNQQAMPVGSLAAFRLRCQFRYV